MVQNDINKEIKEITYSEKFLFIRFADYGP